MKKSYCVKGVKLGMKKLFPEKSGGSYGDTWSGKIGFKEEKETQARCYVSEVHTKYVGVTKMIKEMHEKVGRRNTVRKKNIRLKIDVTNFRRRKFFRTDISP